MLNERDVKSLPDLIGDPATVAQQLQSFREASRVLSSQHPGLIEQYPKRWVAVFAGEVRADSESLRELLTLVDRQQLPREHVVVRFIDRDQRTMIL